MKIKFNFCRSSNCGISITDSSIYLEEIIEEFKFREFKSNEIYCLNVLEKHIIGKESEYTLKITNAFETSEFDSLIDGWYTLHHIVLPSKDYFERLKENGGVLYQYNGFYYTDGEKFYKFVDNESSEIDYLEIIIRNPINTSILSYCVDYFSICRLNECYIKLAEKSLMQSFKCKKYQLEDLTFNRDFIWMTLNIIKYYVEENLLENAQILLNDLEVCNNICNNNINKYNITMNNGCGCN